MSKIVRPKKKKASNVDFRILEQRLSSMREEIVALKAQNDARDTTLDAYSREAAYVCGVLDRILAVELKPIMDMEDKRRKTLIPHSHRKTESGYEKAFAEYEGLKQKFAQNAQNQRINEGAYQSILTSLYLAMIPEGQQSEVYVFDPTMRAMGLYEGVLPVSFTHRDSVIKESILFHRKPYIEMGVNDDVPDRIQLSLKHRPENDPIVVRYTEPDSDNLSISIEHLGLLANYQKGKVVSIR